MIKKKFSILVWNLNNRTKDRSVHNLLREVIADQNPDIVTFNEFVDGDQKKPFRDWLIEQGYKYQYANRRIGIHNQVFMGARQEFKTIPLIKVPDRSQLICNTMFVEFSSFKICSLRVPAFKTSREIELAWEYLIGEFKRQMPQIILGDLNVDTSENEHIWEALRGIGFSRVDNSNPTFVSRKGKKRTLDHVLLRGVSDFKLDLIDQFKGKRIVGPDSTFVSDHAGLSLKFDVS